ncbi:MAG: hypothetical protein BMS9Abin01_0822 [Gammaproteobacteria bacterium]|nr:MAG: hypothetical protein BMS9Abin01_0822 [Gammaproteobacteria bacterium]
MQWPLLVRRHRSRILKETLMSIWLLPISF